MSKKRDRFRKLRARYKYCWYCKVEMVNYPLSLGEKAPDNYATIEHINSRIQYPDGRPNIDKTLRVACIKCNNDRANKEIAHLPIQERCRLSGRYPSELKNQLD